ncbi:MAG: hypothetical protein RLZZ155_634 [Bacteroidota bacterium]
MNWRLIAFEMGLFWNEQSSPMINCEAINPADQSSSMINRFAISHYVSNHCVSNIEDELKIDN